MLVPRDLTAIATADIAMNIFAYNHRANYANSISRFAGAVVSVDSQGIRLDLPKLSNRTRQNEDGQLEVVSTENLLFRWDDILKSAEDHGAILISAAPSADPEFHIEQCITQTYFSKLDPRFYKRDYLRFALIYTPSKTCTPDDLVVHLIDDGQIDLSQLHIDGIIESGQPHQVFRHIQLQAPAEAQAGGLVEVNVTQTLPNTTMYFEASSGVLNRERLVSSGSVLIDTTTLAPGDQIKFKAGYKYWPGDAELTILLT